MTSRLLVPLLVLAGCAGGAEGSRIRFAAAVEEHGGADQPRRAWKTPRPSPNRIALLDSDDPLVRMLAFRSLERMTGETFGYDHAGSQLERDQAVDRWVEWYERTGGVEP